MFCSKCGSEIPDGSLFCVQCGASVDASNQGSNETPQILQENTAPEKQKVKKGKSKIKLIIAIAAVLTVVLAGVAGYFIYINMDVTLNSDEMLVYKDCLYIIKTMSSKEYDIEIKNTTTAISGDELNGNRIVIVDYYMIKKSNGFKGSGPTNIFVEDMDVCFVGDSLSKNDRNYEIKNKLYTLESSRRDDPSLEKYNLKNGDDLYCLDISMSKIKRKLKQAGY